MPIASKNPHIVPRPYVNSSILFPDILQSTPQLLSQVLYASTGIYPNLPPANTGLNFSILLRVNRSDDGPIFGPVHIPEGQMFTCYANNIIATGQIQQLGLIPPSHCAVIYAPCTQYRGNTTLNVTQAPAGAKCRPFFTVPDWMGTMAQTDFVWLCGPYIYMFLPLNWVGRCAAVIPTDHSYIISTKVDDILRRRKRETYKPHDPVWGTDVPPEHKLWSDGTKVLYSLFPQVGVGKVMLRYETLNSRFGGFVNTTLAALTGIKEEMQALRLIELQDGMVLDQLAAPMGGVCAMVGASCCSYVPANDEDGGIISQAISNLTALRNAVENDYNMGGNLWSWFMGGRWFEVMAKCLTPILVILLLFCMFASCILPCLRTMVARSVNSTVSQYVMLQQTPYDPDEDPALQEDVLMV